jgi:flagella basal body P-ring formation protein FlgA
MIGSIALMLAVVALLAVPARADESVTLELLDGAAVSGSTYVLGDIAQYSSGSEQLWQALATENLGYAPAMGERITVSARTILGRLGERGYDWRAITLNGPAVITIHGAEQQVGTSALADLLAARIREELGVAAVFNAARELPAVALPGGEAEIRVRFPERSGWWLPDAVEFYVDGLLRDTLLLAQYGSFSLPVVVAPDGIPGRTLIGANYLGSATRELRPGTEVVTQPAQVLGLTTRGAVPAGAMPLASRLKASYDVIRGHEVTLVIQCGAVELRAQALALSDAYVGQLLTVKRSDDGVKFKGRVEAGPLVVVE